MQIAAATTGMPTADLTEAEWDRMASVDVRGVFLCMKYQIPLMLKQGGGTIVNTFFGCRGERDCGAGCILCRQIRHNRSD